MDERIEELYLIASEQFKFVHDQGFPVPHQTRAFAEKFAELIIRECCLVVMEDKAISWTDSIRICNTIKEEFGFK